MKVKMTKDEFVQRMLADQELRKEWQRAGRRAAYDLHYRAIGEAIKRRNSTRKRGRK